MMLLSLVVVGFAAYQLLTAYAQLRKNIAEAKRSGLPYIVSPISPMSTFTYCFHGLFTPILKSMLPRSFWEQWLDLMNPNVHFRMKHTYFDKYHGMFIIVTPYRNQLYVANAEVISQVMGRLEHFPKDIARYELMRRFGENMVTADVATWRVHRKIISSSFNEQNAALVFREATSQSQSMIKAWVESTRKSNMPLQTLERDTNRLALHIIGYAGFGLSLLWPEQALSADASPELRKYASLEAPPDHNLSFVDAVRLLLEKITLISIMPVTVLKFLPFESAKVASQADEDFVKYLSELMDDKIDQTRRGDKVEEGMDLMGHLVRSSHDLAGSVVDKGPSRTRLTRDEIIGNAFIMLLAGHETSANILHFAIVELATNPATQRLVQRDVDELLGDADPEAWEYESVISKLMASMLGAVMNEVLRLKPPVIDIPKMVSADQDQVVTMDGKQYTLPKNTGISIVVVSAQRNPRYWPTQPSKIKLGKSDVDDFVPERWLQSSKSEEKHGDDQAPEDAVTSAQLFRPTPGSFIPFSSGARSCIGRRIAQVEIVAMLAVLFQKYSVELAVDEWASDEDMSNMSREKAREVYAKAQKNSRDTMEEATTVITLKLHGGKHVPVRLVKRGEERFVNWVDTNDDGRS